MVNLWGPGAYGAARPAAVRPSFTPANGPSDPDDWAKDCSSPTARDGTEWRSALLNELIAQLRGVVRSSSVASSNLNPLLLAQAVVSGNTTWAVATGTANAWVVAPSLAVPAYAAGRVLNVRAPATNTSTTVNMNVSGLGNRRIKKADGADPEIGDLIAGRYYPTFDDGTSICILVPLPSDQAAQIAASKSAFNISQISLTTRTPLSGTGFVSYQTGSFTKKSATSDLIVRASTNLFSTATYAAAIMRLVFGATTLEAVAGNSNTTTNIPSPTTERKISGVAAGAVAWSLSFGRNDANAWSSVVNPTAAGDGGNMPAATATSLVISELEP